jgi:hypothetical protein
LAVWNDGDLTALIPGVGRPLQTLKAACFLLTETS